MFGTNWVRLFSAVGIITNAVNKGRKVGSMSSISFVDVCAENTHHRGKYHCMADLLFVSFGFNQTSKADANSTKANPNNVNK